MGKNTPKVPTKKRKRSNEDRNWDPKSERPKKRGAAAQESRPNILTLMGAAFSPAKKIAVLGTAITRLFKSPEKNNPHFYTSPTKLSFSTPPKGMLSRFAITPQGTKLKQRRLVQHDEGTAAIFLPENKVPEEKIEIPAVPHPAIESLDTPDHQEMNGFIDFPITKEKIQAISKLVNERKRKKIHPRGQSQAEVMGGSAAEILLKYGINMPSGYAHWLHFIAFSLIGDEGQCAKNMGIGSKYANAEMEIVNAALKRFMFKKSAPSEIYLSVIPEWFLGYEKIRLLKKVTLTVKNKPGDQSRYFSYEVDALSLNPTCLSEMDIANAMMKKFETNTSQPNPQTAPSSPPAESKILAANSPSRSHTLSAFRHFRANSNLASPPPAAAPYSAPRQNEPTAHKTTKRTRTKLFP